MTQHAFSLIPFSAPDLPDVKITGMISSENNHLALRYILAGNLDEIVLPSPSLSPCRMDDLWKTTCFELFIALKDQPQYWEFNMSPSGDWNVYRMDAYRRVGFREETSIQQLRFDVQRAVDTFALDATIDLNAVFQQNDDLEIGITAIIRTKNGSETYWALTHPAPKVDFHLRKSFILPLAVQTHLLGQSARGG